MTHRYVYADRIDHDADLSECEWVSADSALTADQAAARYALDSAADGFGVVQVSDDEDRPVAWLEMSPGARRVVLRKTNANGSVTTACEWELPDAADAKIPDAVFLSRMTWFAYPAEERFHTTDEAVATVAMRFDPSGRATRERDTNHGFRSPDSLETSEYDRVDVASNWVTIPAFGDWDGFFHPEPAE